MKMTPLRSWASSVALLLPLSTSPVLAHPNPNPTAASATSATSTTSSYEPSCTASLVDTLCDYKKPLSGTAVASSGRGFCWDKCNSDPPCSFVIFLPGNPYLGSGTCWLYPGEDYDESEGTTEGCGNPFLEVYDKPECEEPKKDDDDDSGTPTSDYECSATESPSAVASVCGYPPPDETCWNDCYASSGASNCLSLCAERGDCKYAVFNALNSNKSPYHSGNCWVFSEGEFDEDKAGSCEDGPDQFVYKNECPKPPAASSTTKSGGSDPTATGDKGGDSSDGGKDNNDNDDGDDGDDDGNGNATADGAQADDEDAATSPAVFSVASLVAMGLAYVL